MFTVHIAYINNYFQILYTAIVSNTTKKEGFLRISYKINVCIFTHPGQCLTSGWALLIPHLAQPINIGKTYFRSIQQCVFLQSTAMLFLAISVIIIVILHHHRRHHRQIFCYQKKRWSTYIRHLARRLSHGEFHNLVMELWLANSHEYFQYFWMTPATMDDLLQLVGPHIRHCNTHAIPIGHAERLALTVRYLASGDKMESIGLSYQMHNSSLQNNTRNHWGNMDDSGASLSLHQLLSWLASLCSRLCWQVANDTLC